MATGEAVRKSLGMAVAVVVVLACPGCMSDKGANSETPFEAARYAAIQSHLGSAFTQFCASFGDALDARFETDTAMIPALEWPFEMPQRHRGPNLPYTDATTSWGVGYNLQIDTSKYVAFWNLGRIVDTGVLLHSSPIAATQIEHRIVYGLVNGFGTEKIEWTGTLNVSMSELDSESAQLTASISSDHKIKELCNKQACDHLELSITEAEFGKVGGELSLSTLSGTISGSLKFTEFNAVLGYDGIFVWDVEGTLAGGVATVTVTSGRFSATESYPLCP